MPLSTFSSSYASELKVNQESSKLLVLFSSSLNHAFYSYDFGCNILYVSDKNYTYFTDGADAVAASISHLSRKLDCSKIVMMGGSKGGYAALLHASLGANLSEARYHAIAFGPQTQVYPHNTNIEFPSYIRLMSIAKTDDRIKRELSLFGRISGEFHPRASADIYYSALNHSDTTEALRISGPSIKHHPLRMSGHLAHLPFVINRSDKESVKALIDRAYAQGKSSGDQLIDERAVYVEELLTMPQQPTIYNLVDEALSSD